MSMKIKKSTMYMRQIMKAMVALAVLMSSTASAFAVVTGDNEANDSVSAKAQKALTATATL